MSNINSLNVPIIPAVEQKPDSAQNSNLEVKPNIGVINPPADVPQHSFTKEMQQAAAPINDAFINSAPLASTSISGSNQKKTMNPILKLIITAGVIAGSIYGLKKLDLGGLRNKSHSTWTDMMETGQSIYNDLMDRPCADLPQLRGQLAKLIENSNKTPLNATNLRKASIRLIGQPAEETINVLTTIRDIARETRGITGQTPKISILLKEGAEEYAQQIKEGISTNSLRALPQEVIEAMESVGLEYTKGSKKAGNIILDIFPARILDQSEAGSQSKFAKWAREFFE